MNDESNFISTQLLQKVYPATKRGQEDLTVFDKVNFNIRKGEFTTCIGHSGCGKSTILNILAGLAEPTSGSVMMDGKSVSGPSLDKAVVFQNHSLLPWKTAIENVAFAVKSRHPEWSLLQIRKQCVKYLEMVGLNDSYNRKPSELSGGMRQRVGIARAFAIESKLLLMDEPFGALDALTRGIIQEELIKIWEQTQQTVFMITHDVDEAIFLSDRIFLMTNGPYARVAEAVVVDLPRPRDRSQIVHHPDYYKIRNHLVDFLVSRSHELSGSSNGAEERQEESGTVDGELLLPPDVNPALA